MHRVECSYTSVTSEPLTPLYMVMQSCCCRACQGAAASSPHRACCCISAFRRLPISATLPATKTSAYKWFTMALAASSLVDADRLAAMRSKAPDIPQAEKHEGSTHRLAQNVDSESCEADAAVLEIALFCILFLTLTNPAAGGCLGGS
jgi:hypothetical protein